MTEGPPYRRCSEFKPSDPLERPCFNTLRADSTSLIEISTSRTWSSCKNDLASNELTSSTEDTHAFVGKADEARPEK